MSWFGEHFNKALREWKQDTKEAALLFKLNMKSLPFYAAFTLQIMRSPKSVLCLCSQNNDHVLSAFAQVAKFNYQMKKQSE